MNKLTICGLEFNLDLHTISYNNVVIPFTKTEFLMMHALALKYQKGYISVRQFRRLPPTNSLLKQPPESSYRVMICRIKKKLFEVTGKTDILRTYTGQGYAFNNEM